MSWKIWSLNGLTFVRKFRSERLNTIRKPHKNVNMLAQLKGMIRACALQVWTERRELDLRPSMLIKRGQLSGMKNKFWRTWIRVAPFSWPSVKISLGRDPWWKYYDGTGPLRKIPIFQLYFLERILHLQMCLPFNTTLQFWDSSFKFLTRIFFFLKECITISRFRNLEMFF
jgi:hypothetical protein